MIAATTIWLTIALHPSRTPPRPEIMARFETVVSTTSDRRIPFRLYCPSDRSSKAPLLVWLHGRGEAGDNNEDQLAWLELLFENHAQPELSCYVLALQRPADAPNWLAANSNQIQPLRRLNQLVDEVLRRYPIDQQRIYLAGISSGASGCWELAKLYPDRFAAVVPMAATTVDMTRLDRLTDLPIWAFQSTGDGPASVGQVRQLVRRIKRLGGRVHLTVVAQPSHDCWTSAFVDEDVGNWMLAQQRESFLAPPPGGRVSQFIGAAFAVTALIVLAAVAIARRRLTRRLKQLTNSSSPFY